MNYYRYDPDTNNYNAFTLSDRDHRRILDAFFTNQRIARKIPKIILFGFEDNPGPDGDFPTLNDYGDIPLCSVRAWEKLQPLIGHCTEAIPAVHPNGTPLFAIHVLDVVDCLDEARSEVTRNAATNRISWVHRFALKKELLIDKHIFVLPAKSGRDVLISDDFKNVCDQHGLIGLRFRAL